VNPISSFSSPLPENLSIDLEQKSELGSITKLFLFEEHDAVITEGRPPMDQSLSSSSQIKKTTYKTEGAAKTK